MKKFISTYQRLTLFSFLIFCAVWNFVFGTLSFFDQDEARAASFTAAQSGDWNIGTTWGNGCTSSCTEGVHYPGASDTATVVSSTANIMVTVPLGVTANFSTLTVGGDATYTAVLSLVGNIGTGGNITVETKGSLIQKNTTTQTITGTLTVNSGGAMTHEANTSTHIYELDFYANAITVNSGAMVSTTGKGFSGGTFANDGYGPGPGTNTGASNQKGSGGAHGGRGGDDGNGDLGGTAYCTSTNPGTLGSGGGGGGNVAGGAGGGLIRFEAADTITIAGSILANGNEGNEDTSYDAGGGAGGGIRLVGATVNISNSTIRANGGNSGTDFDSGGGGGGGCVAVTYSTSYTYSGATTSTSAGSGYSGGGTPAAAGTWVVASLNSAPSVSAFSPIIATDGGGIVTVTTTVTDTESNTTTLYVDFSVDNGATWASSTLFSHESWGGTGISAVTGTISNVTTSPSGRLLTIMWGSQDDNVTTSTQVVLRIRPYDGSSYGSFVTSSAFTLDNAAPTTPGGLSAVAITTSTITLGFGVTSTDPNFSHYLIYNDRGSSVTTSSPTIGTSTEPNLGNINFNGATTTVFTATSSPNTQYAFGVLAVDSFGNRVISTSTLVVYTYAMTPGQPAVGTSTASSVTVTLGSDSNATSTEYAIYNATAGTYVTAVGAASASPVYRTSTAWGAVAVTGLTANTGYEFNIIARNGDGVTTTLSATSTAVYTLASTPSLVSASASGSQVTVSWSGNATQYYVSYSGGNSGWISSTSYVFSSVSCGSSFTFSVKGKNAAGVETSAATVTVTTESCGGGGPVIASPAPTQQAPTQVTPTDPVTQTQEEAVQQETKTEEQKTEEQPEKKQEIKQEIKTPEKTVQKNELQPNPNTEAASSDAQSGSSDAASPGAEGSAPAVSIADAGIKIVKEGEVLKVTNDTFVTLQLDTAYNKVTLQDESGRTLDQVAVESSVPWRLSDGDGQKCITATFYDAAGNPAKQKVTCVGLDTTPPPAPKVRGVDTSFVLEKQGKKVSVRGTSEPRAIIQLRIYQTGPLAFFILAAHAASEGYFVTTADEKGNWSFTFPDIFDSGNYEVEVTAKDEAGNVSQPVKTAFTVTTQVVQAAVEAVQEVIDNPEVERINETYVAPAIVGVGVANVATGAQLPQIFIYLKYLFAQPLLLLRRKKHKTWGTVYNAYTKQPVDLATVRLVHAEQGTVIKSQVTDTQGRYYMFGEPGEYRIEVDKNGFGGVSGILKEKQEDGSYLRVYHGDQIHVNDDHTEINYSIPLEPVGEVKPAEKLIREKIIATFQHALSLSGVVVTGMSFIISPEIKIAVFFFVHLLFYAISYRFTHVKLPESFGTVRSLEDKNGLHNVVVRVFDSAYNKLITTTLTDRKGRYAALVGPSVYYVAYEKPGFETKKSGILDYSSKKTQGIGGMIIRDEELRTANATVPAAPVLSESQKPVVQSSATQSAVDTSKYTVMPIIPEPATTATAITPKPDSTSLTADAPEDAAKKSDDRVDNPDDLIAQWKQNH